MKEQDLQSQDDRLQLILERYDQSLIDRFICDYEPWPTIDYESVGVEILTIPTLRTRFNAWLAYGCPDIWPKYQQELADHGYHLVPDYDHTPVLPVHRRTAPIPAQAEEIK